MPQRRAGFFTHRKNRKPWRYAQGLAGGAFRGRKRRDPAGLANRRNAGRSADPFGARPASARPVPRGIRQWPDDPPPIPTMFAIPSNWGDAMPISWAIYLRRPPTAARLVTLTRRHWADQGIASKRLESPPLVRHGSG